MPNSTRIVDYLGAGRLVDRPVEAPVADGCLALWFAKDENILYGWKDAAWSNINGPAGVSTGTALLEFGDTPSQEAAVVVTGQSGINASAKVQAWWQADTTTFNTADDHLLAASSVSLTSDIPVAGVGFTIHADSNFALWTKQFRVRWAWRN